MLQEDITELVLKKYTGASVPLLQNFTEQFFQKTPLNYQNVFEKEDFADFILVRFQAFQEIIENKSCIDLTVVKEPAQVFGNNTLIDAAVPNSPFIIETVLAYLSFHKKTLTFSVRFNVMVPTGEEEQEVSYSHYIIDPLNDEDAIVAKETLMKSLEGVQLVTDDFQKTKEIIDKTITDIGGKETNEAFNFLRWLKDNNFIFFGVARVDLSGTEVREIGDSGLGLLRREAGLQKRFFSYVADNSLKLVSTVITNEISYVHKFEHIILIRMKTTNDAEELILIGHFTSAAKRLEFSTIPVIREKINVILEEEGFLTNSYDYKNEYLLLHKFPLEELFSLSTDVIKKVTSFLRGIGSHSPSDFLLEYEQSLQLLIGAVHFPADIFTPKLFQKIKNVFNDELAEKPFRSYSFSLNNERIVLHFYANVEEGFEFDKHSLTKRVMSLCKSWETDVYDQIVMMTGEEPSTTELQEYFSNLPPDYKSAISMEFAAVDFMYIHYFKDEEKKVEAFIKRQEENNFVLRFYSNYDITLSEIMPILSSFHFNVENSDHFTISQIASKIKVKIKTFEVIFSDTFHKEFGDIRESLLNSLVAALGHTTPVDPLNQLSLKIGLPHRKLNLLRTYRNLLIQHTGTLKISSINAAFIKYEEITEALLDFFHVKFSPDKEFASLDERIVALEAMKEELNTKLLDVVGIQDDRIIRSVLKLMNATLRTNYFISERKMFDTTISLKVDSKQIDFAVEPRPFREIFVYDLDMEGIHLRGGKIARGGLRWSDRTDDFRTEVLGLMKTQMVKNTIIVPVGSKGGFIVKRTKANVDQDFGELGVQCYRKFISGLLDITDNYSLGNAEIRPQQCIIYDEFDPYLVVAADKGTASFSDIANELSIHYNFWLKDAFASGGSNGYNHKEMGITARGAWECAKRHFREMDINIQTQSITVVGIGDMSGDVFGNGMLLSKKIKMVAAFNHLHVFIDPSPASPEASHAERQRLFDMERSAWTDYSKDLISKGGGVFKRDAKAITLSEEIKALLNTTLDEVNGEELIKLVLKAPVDMIFNGGIGTYIKASTETHPEVDDKANDNVRVSATEVQAKAIVEGGNLGITQKARVEYEKHGGIINTDAIDNSAGVDTSDHEVNLKILIESLKANGKIASDEEGNKTLREFQDYVAKRTLRHNSQQSAAISMDLYYYKENPTDFFDTLKTLEAECLLNREEDDVPSDGEIEYMIQHSGMPRSIHSYVLGLEKIRLYNIISESEITKLPAFQKFLFEYFPPKLHESAREEIINHRLSRNIIATFLVNRVINRGGLSFVHSLAFHSLASVEDILETYYFVDEIIGAEEFRSRAMDLEYIIPTKVLYRMLRRYERVIYKMVRWILQQGKDEFVDFTKVASYKEKIQHYFKEYFLFLSEISPESYKHVFDEIEHLKENSVPEDLATEAAYSIFLKPALGLIRISEETNLSIRMVAESNIIIGERFHLNYIHIYLRSLTTKTEWDKACYSSLESELYSNQDKLVCKILAIPSNGKATNSLETSPLSRIYKFLGITSEHKEEKTSIKCEEMRRNIIEKLDIFIEHNSTVVSELDKMIEKLKGSGSTSLTPVVVIEKFITKLVNGNT